MKGARQLPMSNVRMPHDLKNWYKHIAVQEDRSVNSLMVIALKKFKQDYEAENDE